MSFPGMLEENNNFGAEQRYHADDERMSVYRRLEKKLDDIMLAFQQMGSQLAEFEGKIVKLEFTVNELSASMKSDTERNAHKSKQRGLNLQFADAISSPIRTGDEIKAVGGDYVKVELRDENGKLVDSGPESSAEVHIFAFKGGIDDNEGDRGDKGHFVDGIARERTTKKLPILVGDVHLKLNNGTGTLSKVKFRSSSSHMSGVFMLGARVVDHFDGIVIQDAKTLSFRVRDYRGKYNEKHRPPFVSDEVWRLDNIGRGGKIHAHLEEKNFNTVEDFLIQLLKDSDELKQLVGLEPKKWKATVKHALTCQLDEKVYCSISSVEKKGIVFNAVGKVLGQIVESKYIPFNKLSYEAKVDASKLDVAEFVHKAGGLVPFADEASILQQFPEPVNVLHPSNCTRSQNTIYHEEDEASEIGEFHQQNLVASSENVPSSSHPIEVNASKLDVAAFVHNGGGLVPSADDASVLQQFPELVNALHPSMSQNTIDHEFCQQNWVTSFEDVPSSSHPMEVNASKFDVAAFAHNGGGGLVPSADDASVLQQFPELVNALHPSNCTRSQRTIDHESEVSEVGESHETNLDDSFKDVSSSSHPIEINQFLDQPYIDFLFDACDNNQNASFSEMLRESPVVSNEVKKKLMILFTAVKWFLNYDKTAARDGNDNRKRQRIS